MLGIVASRAGGAISPPGVRAEPESKMALAQGSGRSIRPFHLLEALESMPELF